VDCSSHEKHEIKRQTKKYFTVYSTHKDQKDYII